jgi:hypothetical protein
MDLMFGFARKRKVATPAAVAFVVVAWDATSRSYLSIETPR